MLSDNTNTPGSYQQGNPKHGDIHTLWSQATKRPKQAICPETPGVMTRKEVHKQNIKVSRK